MTTSAEREVARLLNERDPAGEALAKEVARRIYLHCYTPACPFNRIELALLVEHFTDILLERLKQG